MKFGSGIPRARILSLADIGGSFGVSPPLGCALVTSQLGNSNATGGELEEGVGGRRVIQVVVLIAGISG